MRRTLLAAALLMPQAASAAQPAPLAPGLAGLAFLLGQWTGGDGKVADTGGTSKGVSSITALAISFAILPPGATTPRPIATGTLHKQL
jgi:hypothetical protein